MSLASHPATYWRGGLTCVRAAAMLTGMVALLILQGHGAIAAGIMLTQGSYRPWSRYSANTHAGCGVIDISRFNAVTGRLWTQAEWAIIIAAARQVGFAGWHRLAIVGLWVEHGHLVAIGCPDLNIPDATNQVTEYHQGFDGLSGNGLDNGPRNWVNVTWETYKAAHAPVTIAPPITEDEDDMITPETTAALLRSLTGAPALQSAIDWHVDDAIKNALTPQQVRTLIGRTEAARTRAIQVSYHAFLTPARLRETGPWREATAAEIKSWLATGKDYDSLMGAIGGSSEAVAATKAI